jgi:hypothetical protein
MSIKTKRLSIEKKMGMLRLELKELQELCNHGYATHTNKASTGNYDPSCDEYWTDHYCDDCGKHWMTDQDWCFKK